MQYKVWWVQSLMKVAMLLYLMKYKNDMHASAGDCLAFELSNYDLQDIIY